MPKSNGEKGVVASMLKSFASVLFPAYMENNERDRVAMVQDSPLSSARVGISHGQSADPHSDADMMDISGMQLERAEKYAQYAEMANDPLVDEALTIHVSNALSADTETRQAITLATNQEEFADLVKELNDELMPMINKDIVDWAKTMVTYGVSYVRPYAKDGQGITHIEHSYWTLPHHVREYERSGLLAGYTNMYLKERSKGAAVQLAPPWTLVPIKVPFHQPHPEVMPQNMGVEYSLFDDLLDQSICETQNYGHSFLAKTYEPYRDLLDAIDSMRGSRRNASRIDRMIMLPMETLDPIQAAEYGNFVAAQLKANVEAQERKNWLRKLRPLITNSLIPINGASKGQVAIDTQRVDPNIADIEDILFHLRRLASSMGLDASMLGWADLLSGGLGEGGFFQTSIQSTRRAEWIRQGCTNAIERLIDLHLWHKHKKVFPHGAKRPWTVTFTGLNTAVEQAEADSRETNANRSLIVTQLIDGLTGGAAKNSAKLVELLLTPVLNTDPDTVKTIAKELIEAGKQEAAQAEDGGGDLMSSFTGVNDKIDHLLSGMDSSEQQVLLQSVMHKLLLSGE
jgi:hypothetical protein